MGILGLSKLIGDVAPDSIKENPYKSYFGRKVAIDASMSLYQALIAVRQDGVQLTSPDGETTSHLSGFFYRTIRMMDNGIKPLYVFDGKPPQMKSGELEKRREKREEAQKALDTAKESGTVEEVDKQSRRIVKVTKTHVEEAQKLLKLMGIPYIVAPSEAEAQCAVLQKAGKVFGVATEDMDALTFGTQVLLRNLTASEAKKLPVREFHLDKVLEGMGFTMDQFVDLCILLGCDYCDSIKGVGPKKAIELLEKYKDIETILENMNVGRKGAPLVVPEFWPYEQARKFFKEPEVTDPSEIEFSWGSPNVAELVAYMCGEKGFDEKRMVSGCEKLIKAKGRSTQGRLENFFRVLPSSNTGSGAKRPASLSKESDKDKKKAKGGKGGGKGAPGKRGK